MRIIRHLRDTPSAYHGSVIALGNFDGMHLGHQTVIRTAIDSANQENTMAAVMTFEPHPVTILRPDQPPYCIASFRSKIEQLQHIGIDAVFAIPFTDHFSKLPAETFIHDILFDALHVRHIVVGYDFIFGYKRSGNAELLKTAAEKAGILFTNVPQVTINGDICASSNIRRYLKEGNIAAANKMLGIPYHLSGKVIKGEQRGRLIGFPTANLSLHQLMRPALGVYAAQVMIEGDPILHNAVANLGKKPTFNGQNELLEVHLLDHQADLYGKRLTVYFKEYLRAERKFDGLAALTAQIQQDANQARELLRTI